MVADIGVVIPAYNRDQTLGRAIESVLAQTVPSGRVVVVDDGSTDATAEVAGSFGSEVTVLVTENGGAARARNRGVDAMTLPWVAFLDSDDYWSPDHLERIGAAIAGTSERADCYFDDTIRTKSEGSVSLWSLAGFSLESPWQLIEDATPWVMLPRQPLMLQSSVFRRARYVAVGGLDQRLRSRHDTHLFFVLGIGASFCAVAGTGATMTDDDRSGSRQMDALGWSTDSFARYTVELYRDILDRFPELPSEHRRQLRRRLCEAELRLVRFAGRDRRLLPAASALAGALRADPVRTIRGAGQVIGRSVRQAEP